MEHIELYKAQLKTCNQKIIELEEEQNKLMNEVLELRDEVYNWKEKYKELRKTVIG